jgi:hypothetical protein
MHKLEVRIGILVQELQNWFAFQIKPKKEWSCDRQRSFHACLLSIVGVCALAPRIPAQTLASPHPTVIAASVVIDGKGYLLHDIRIVIEGPKICDRS